MEVLKKFRQVFRAAKLHFSAVEKRAGVTGAQLWALCELDEQPGVRVTDLAAAMALHQSTVSNLIDKLLRKRLIRRDRGDIDGRVVRLYLTAAGERVVRSAPQPARGVLPDALEHLPPTTLRGFDQQLANLLAAHAGQGAGRRDDAHPGNVSCGARADRERCRALADPPERHPVGSPCSG